MQKVQKEARPHTFFPTIASMPHRELGGATSVAVSPSGRDVYVASSNPGALAHFCVDESTGELQEVELEGATTTTQLDLDGASLVSRIELSNRSFDASVVAQFLCG